MLFSRNASSMAFLGNHFVEMPSQQECLQQDASSGGTCVHVRFAIVPRQQNLRARGALLSASPRPHLASNLGFLMHGPAFIGPFHFKSFVSAR